MPLAVLLPIGLVLLLSFHEIRAIHRKNVASALQAVLSTTREGLLTWARQAKATTAFWASKPSVRRAVAAQLEQRRERRSLHDSPHFQELRLELDNVVQPNGCLGFDVLAMDGTHIASDRDDFLGTTILSAHDPDTIAAAMRGSMVIGTPFPLWSPVPGKLVPMLLVAAPVRAMAEGGEIIAALVFRIDPGREFAEIAQQGQIGPGGETYAFDRRGRIVTELRFAQSLRDLGLLAAGARSSLNVEVRDPGGDTPERFRRSLPRGEQPLTRMAASAIAKNAGVDVDGYRDYRGVEVVGSWLWDPELDLGLATEVDKVHAYGLYDATRRVVLVACAVMLLTTLTMTTLLHRRASDLAGGVAREQRLRRELEGRVRQLDRAEAELKDAVRLREEFLRFASHELRTPLTSLRLLWERLFEPFRWKPDAHGGLGVGLHVCKLIVAAHGGEILVESETGKGTTVSVRLPLPPEIERDDAAPAPAFDERTTM